MKVAETAFAAFMLTMQLAVPVHAPLQPMKVEPALGLALRVTNVPAENLVEHAAPQLIPAGDEVTVPVPLPDFDTVRVTAVSNFAEIDFGPLITSWHVPLPLQSPVHPEKIEPGFSEAVTTTEVPIA